MSKSFLLLSFLMGVVVLSLNYLVQFPINYYGFNDILNLRAFPSPRASLIIQLVNSTYSKNVARKISYFVFVISLSITVISFTVFASLPSKSIVNESEIPFIPANL